MKPSEANGTGKPIVSLEMYNTMSVSKAVIKNVVPAIAASIMVLLYNMADTLFIGMTDDPIQVAAVTVCTPVFLLFMAIGTIFGIGGTSVISRALGKGQHEYARKVCSFCMWSCVFLGIVMSVFFLLFMNQVLSVVGTSPETEGFIRDYLTIVVISGPFVLIGNCYSNILRTEGQAVKAMLGMSLGNLLNIVLDPIFILAFGMGVKGAALATMISCVVGGGYYIIYFLRGQSGLSVNIKDFKVNEKIASSVLAIGTPASLMTVLMSVSQIILMNLMNAYGDMAIAGVGVATKVSMLASMTAMGMGQGIQPLLGYCVGARKWKRFNEILKFSLILALVFSVTLMAICYLFTNQIVQVFLNNQEAFDYGVRFARILLSTGALFGVFNVLANTLQAMGAALPSLIINLSRQGIIYIPALFILDALFGVDGLIWAQPVVDILSVILSICLVWIVYRRMNNDTQQMTLEPEPEPEEIFNKLI